MGELNTTARRHESFDAIHIGVDESYSLGIRFPHHFISRINANVVNVLYRTVIGIEK